MLRWPSAASRRGPSRATAPRALTASELRYVDGGLAFVVHEGDTRAAVTTALIGDYNIANLLCVIGSLRALGVELGDAAAACRELMPVPGRMQLVRDASSTTSDAPDVVVDYAHTPDALEKALGALVPLARERGGALWCGVRLRRQSRRGQAAAHGRDRRPRRRPRRRHERQPAPRIGRLHHLADPRRHDRPRRHRRDREPRRSDPPRRRLGTAERCRARRRQRARGPSGHRRHEVSVLRRGARCGSIAHEDVDAHARCRCRHGARCARHRRRLALVRAGRERYADAAPRATSSSPCAASASTRTISWRARKTPAPLPRSPSTAWPKRGSTVIEVADARVALGALAAAWRRRFTLPLIAVTGSNGKTTVTQMVASILRAWLGDGAFATEGNFQQRHRRAADPAAPARRRGNAAPRRRGRARHESPG